MARGRRSKRHYRDGRVVSINAKRASFFDVERELIYGLGLPSTLASLPVSDTLSVGEESALGVFADRRLYHPLGAVRPAYSYLGKGHELQVGRKLRQAAKAVPYTVSFLAPSTLMVCQKRQERREVMHALGVAGSSGLRPPRRNWLSNISCKG